MLTGTECKQLHGAVFLPEQSRMIECTRTRSQSIGSDKREPQVVGLVGLGGTMTWTNARVCLTIRKGDGRRCFCEFTEKTCDSSQTTPWEESGLEANDRAAQASFLKY